MDAYGHFIWDMTIRFITLRDFFRLRSVSKDIAMLKQYQPSVHLTHDMSEAELVGCLNGIYGIERLDLSWRRTIGDAFLLLPNTIKCLYITELHITDMHVQVLSSLPELTELCMTWCTFKRNDLLCDLRADKLVTLDLTCTKVFDVAVCHLAQLPQLNTLILAHCGKLTDACCNDLRKIKDCVVTGCNFDLLPR